MTSLTTHTHRYTCRHVHQVVADLYHKSSSNYILIISTKILKIPEAPCLIRWIPFLDLI